MALSVLSVYFLQFDCRQNDRIGMHDVIKNTHISYNFYSELVLFLPEFVANINIILFLDLFNLV